MFATSNVSIRETVVLAAGASLLAVLCACATTPAPQSAAGPETAVISELQVESEGGATIVSLLGLAEPDLDDVPEDVKEVMTFILADQVDQVFGAALADQ